MTTMNTNPLPEPSAEFDMVLRLTEELGDSESKIMKLEEELEKMRQRMLEQVRINFVYSKCGNWICNDGNVDIVDFTDNFITNLYCVLDVDLGEEERTLAIDMYYKNQLRPKDCYWEKDDSDVLDKIRDFYDEMVEDNDIDVDECDPETDEHLPHNFVYYHRVCAMGECWFQYHEDLHEVIDWAIELPWGKGYYIQYS